MLSSVHGVIAGLEMPFELKNPDACRDTGLSCPLNPGAHTYTYSLYVDKTKPRVSPAPHSSFSIFVCNAPVFLCLFFPQFDAVRAFLFYVVRKCSPPLQIKMRK